MRRAAIEAQNDLMLLRQHRLAADVVTEDQDETAVSSSPSPNAANAGR